MTDRSKPDEAWFEHQKKLAKKLLDAAKAADPHARECLRRYHPRGADALAAPRLADAQLALARSQGFASWARLKHELAVLGRYLWTPPGARAGETPAERFVRAACLDYERWTPARLAEAERLLGEHPELAHASLHAAAAAGDVEAVRVWIEREPGLVHARGGALGWEPLLCAAYSRFTARGHSTLDVARLLLARGADPDAGFLWRGNAPPFTALTGAFGEGEDQRNMPPHPERDALARLLLEHGADPNDEQTLYNRHFRAADDHLELLFEFGLGKPHGGPWFARLGERLHTPERMLVEELWAAAKNGFEARVRLLVARGVDVNTPGLRDGKTPHEAALRAGHRSIAEFLEQQGARTTELAPEERFAAACVADDGATVAALITADPGLVARLGPARQTELVALAVAARRPAAIRRMAALGFALDTLARNTPLHDAAWAGELELVQLLIELGADPTARDREFNATPLGWADHNGQAHVVAWLRPLTGEVE